MNRLRQIRSRQLRRPAVVIINPEVIEGLRLGTRDDLSAKYERSNCHGGHEFARRQDALVARLDAED